ncbi:MAG: hypothetical protein HRU41_08580 [Saprospiraceae bacterium]|nr:hypothetical protein [Saprospiraceae bacterium]
MDYFKILLGGLLGLLAIIIALWVLPDIPQATSQLHPEYKTLLKSGNSVTEQSSVKWLAYFFGLLILFIFVATVFIGARRKRSTGNLRYWLLAGSIAYAITYHLSIMAYWRYANASETQYFGGLPIPTAWAIYGIWSVPIIMTLVYVFRFDEWILDQRDMEEFKVLVEGRGGK